MVPGIAGGVGSAGTDGSDGNGEALGRVGMAAIMRDHPEVKVDISFDDIEEAVDVFPALTTLRQPVGEMAEQAIRLLLSLIENPLQDVSDNRILVQPSLMIRRSCSPAVQ